MEIKYIKTQEEFEKLIESGYDGIIVIEETEGIFNINDTGDAIVHIEGKAKIDHISGSAKIYDISDSAKIDHISGSAKIYRILDSARINYIYGSAKIYRIFDSAEINRIFDSAEIDHIYDSAKVYSISGSAKVLDFRNDPYNLDRFINHFDVEYFDDDHIILYKTVQDDYTDFRTGTVLYEVGTIVECPDWVDDYEEECGYGLHLAPSLNIAMEYNEGRGLRCKVNKNDIVVHSNPYMPDKVRCKRVEVLEEI